MSRRRKQPQQSAARKAWKARPFPKTHLGKGSDTRYHPGDHHYRRRALVPFGKHMGIEQRNPKKAAMSIVPVCGACDCKATGHEIYRVGERGGPCRCGECDGWKD